MQELVSLRAVARFGNLAAGRPSSVIPARGAACGAGSQRCVNNLWERRACARGGATFLRPGSPGAGLFPEPREVTTLCRRRNGGLWATSCHVIASRVWGRRDWECWRAEARCGDSKVLGALLPIFWEGLSERFQIQKAEV